MFKKKPVNFRIVKRWRDGDWLWYVESQPDWLARLFNDWYFESLHLSYEKACLAVDFHRRKYKAEEMVVWHGT